MNTVRSGKSWAAHPFPVISVLIFIFLFFPQFFSGAGTGNVERPYQLIAPVFGEMLANQIHVQLYPSSRTEKHRQTEKVTIIFYSNDDGTVAHDFLFTVQQKAVKSKTWREFQKQIKAMDVLSSEAMQRIAEVKNKGFLNYKSLISSNDQLPELLETVKGKWILAIISKEPETGDLVKVINKKIIFNATLSELEFTKNESGRQVLNLDQPELQSLILKRLVERSMSPVSAHPYIKKLIEDFRSDREDRLFLLANS